uniref:Replication factor A n=1 Tax=Pyrococcus abyssi (strain GE5 / Orsay) TaxID=272844 RepID=UPI00247B2E4D|nr:Chain A, Replication factor A [Pyrococcus abyssi GE5]8C5Z_A Chain A, Replication factor A [Pyrococcus abyssi]8C5Z_D Chain D, Replication factor A [Pyrococcus abyssi]8C5Z_G Chain G, Replication factor A [Pyrococcus abyssi]8C5Z_J Chain J, Replication factor A [Pyrococcus abyssi]8OEJ_A Chain A, Replication factor A [Pyrococcus abyssi]8OEJ_D Chain D, Replication factor A [Pyrococcus abyssi]8OEL_A Chain A, Replication factor A [Pyrococcus abyssi]8OEL_D Chain D, Replication factor A [Pyrococcu
MSVLTKDRIIEIIERKTGMSREEIEEEIRKIMEEDPYLSEQGAAALLAERLGIDLIEKEEVSLMRISELYPGMDPREVNVVGRVLKKYPPREYTRKDGSVGRVASLIIYDDSGRARVVLWDAKVSEYYNKIEVGDVIKVLDAQVKESLSGLPELHINFRARIILNPDDPRVEMIPPLEEVRVATYTRKKIKDIEAGDRFVEVRGTIAKVYRVLTYDACPECKKKVDYDEGLGVWICPEHGEVQPIKMTILDFGLDDGTGYIRVTLFGDDAEELLGVSPEEIAEKIKELEESGLTTKEAARKLAEDEFYNIIGREIVVRGNVIEDRFLGLILRASSWEDVDYRREIERIKEELEKLGVM